MEELAVNGIAQTNGIVARLQDASNATTTSSNPKVKAKVEEMDADQREAAVVKHEPINRPDGLPIEIKQLIQYFQPFHILVNRQVQTTWNDLSDLLDQLAEIDVQHKQNAPTKALINGAGPGQSFGNLEKKERLLQFQETQRSRYLRLLVLHDWVKKSRGIDKVIDLSSWLHELRAHFNEAADGIGNMKRELAVWQLPNPDLKTAAEILSRGRASRFSKLGYGKKKELSAKAMLRTLQEINILLCGRLTIHSPPPLPLSKYRIHDGRVTFTVAHEFELDLSLADEDPASQFYFINFRFLFEPRFRLEGRLHDDFSAKMNGVLAREGLQGCYDYLHDMTLTHKINLLHTQAKQMALKQWNGMLAVQLIQRTLVLHYWTGRPLAKSWVEIGINRGRLHPRGHNGAYLAVRWKPEKKLDEDAEIDFDETPLSAERILREIIARHIIGILDGLYEQLVQCKIYAEGKLRLDLSCSPNPSDCYLEMQLTSQRQIQLAVESISGSLILRPASSLSGRSEFELNRLQNPKEQTLPLLCVLRCIAAEQEATQQAHLSGWETMQLSRKAEGAVKSLLPKTTRRHALYRLARWRPNVMVAATFSVEEDQWWTLYPIDPENADPPRYHIEPMTLASQEPSWDFFADLKDFASGLIVSKMAERDMIEMKLPVKSHSPEGSVKLPAFQIKYRQRAFRDSDKRQEAKADIKPAASSSFIKEAIWVKVDGVRKGDGSIVLLAAGSFQGPGDVSGKLALLKEEGFRVNFKHPRHPRFEFRISLEAGQLFVSDLLQRVRSLDRLISCLRMLRPHSSMTIKSLSMTEIRIGYGTNLEAQLDLPSTGPCQLHLSPPTSNPQIRILAFLQSLLADANGSFALRLGAALEILDRTLPLLNLLYEFETTPSTPTDSKAASSLAITTNIISRDSTYYGLQYFISPQRPPLMIARFEIRTSRRGDALQWVLRPAIEEKLSYKRGSFIDNSLKDQFTTEICTPSASPDWTGLDTGAACPISFPGPLLKRVNDLVRSWINDSKNRGVIDAATAASLAREKEREAPRVTPAAPLPKTPQKTSGPAGKNKPDSATRVAPPPPPPQTPNQQVGRGPKNQNQNQTQNQAQQQKQPPQQTHPSQQPRSQPQQPQQPQRPNSTAQNQNRMPPNRPGQGQLGPAGRGGMIQNPGHSPGQGQGQGQPQGPGQGRGGMQMQMGMSPNHNNSPNMPPNMNPNMAINPNTGMPMNMNMPMNGPMGGMNTNPAAAAAYQRHMAGVLAQGMHQNQGQNRGQNQNPNANPNGNPNGNPNVNANPNAQMGMNMGMNPNAHVNMNMMGNMQMGRGVGVIGGVVGGGMQNMQGLQGMQGMQVGGNMGMGRGQGQGQMQHAQGQQVLGQPRGRGTGGGGVGGGGGGGGGGPKDVINID